MEKESSIRYTTSLSGRAIIAISALLTVISVVLSVYFTFNQKAYMKEELIKRSKALANNLAYNSQYLVFTNFIQDLQPLINGVMNEEDIIYSYITDVEGNIIGHSDTLMYGKSIDISHLSVQNIKSTQFLETTGHNTKNTIIEIISPIEFNVEKGLRNEETLFDKAGPASGTPDLEKEAVNPQKHLIGLVFLGVSTENLNRAIEKVQMFGFLLTLGILVCGILVTVIMMTRFITRPLHNLMYATKIVASGNLDHIVAVGRNDEIGVLSRSFNQMTSELKKSREKIEEWNRILESKVIERTKELSKKNLELRKYSDELQKAFEELKTLDKSKDDFLALVSHELRTPLSSIVAYTEVLLDGMAETEEEENKYLTIIKDESDRLTRLINNVLDLSKMEAGRMPFGFRTTELRNLINTCVAGLTGIANKRNHTIVNNLEKSPLLVNVDPDRILQVLSNIISNAVKFSEDGKTISVSGKEYDSMVEITITDQGFGIKKEDHDKVFDKFQQIEDVDHHSEGTGLGMPISKIIIENHKGKIWFDSEVGKGTSFHFTLPVVKQ